MSGDPQVTVRRARPDDREGLFPLARELATTSVPARTDFDRTFSRVLGDEDAVVLVAEEVASARLFGYLLGFRHETFFANGPVGWVEEVFIRPDIRRSGIGKALMREFEGWWRSGASWVALATRRADHFYRAIGYEDSAVYYRKPAPS
jgi:GNAT superfamily N-acetyltransferase